MPLLVGLLLLFQTTMPAGVPPELKAALASRQFLNAQITWEASDRTPAGAWGIATYVGSQIAYETHFPEGPPGSSLVDHAILRGLYWEGQLLENSGDPLSARLLEDPAMGGGGVPMDYRVLGMHGRTSTERNHNPFEPLGTEAPQYSVDRRDGLVVVSAREQVGGRLFERRWSIDPRQGWNVLLFESLQDGRPTISVATTLARAGEHWFPQEVEYRNPDGPFLTIRITNAKLNDPSLPGQLTPAFIEVVPGTNVYRMSRDGPSEKGSFDETGFVNDAEFKRRLRAGELKRGEAFVRGVERLKEIGARLRAAKKGTPSAWEEYVAEFIAKHSLDDAQATRAWSIYRDCRDAADQWIDRHRSEYDELDKQQRSAKSASDANEAAAVAARAQQLRRPIVEIFDERLVPRLERLLTREQRTLDSPTSRPASRSP